MLQMKTILQFLLPLAVPGCFLATLLFVARLIVAPFSAKVAGQMQKHPVLHTIWGGLALVCFLAIWGILNPGLWPPRSVERRQQRQEVFKRVQRAGGWEAVRSGCESLVTNYPNGLSWFPPRSNVQVYPNPQTEPQRYYVTNLDYGSLPSSILALQPREIRYYPQLTLPKDGLPAAVVRIKIFGAHATGGHSIPYFGLEVACGPNAESYRPQSVRDGMSGSHYRGSDQVAEGIYEVY